MFKAVFHEQANTAVYASSPPATLPSASTSITVDVNNTDGPSILYVDGECSALPAGPLPETLCLWSTALQSCRGLPVSGSDLGPAHADKSCLSSPPFRAMLPHAQWDM